MSYSHQAGLPVACAFLLLVLKLSTGCETPGNDSQEPRDSQTPADTGPQDSWTYIEGCPDSELAAGADLAHTVLHHGEIWSYTGAWPSEGYSAVITDDKSYQAFQQQAELSLDGVDFATQQVLAASVLVSSTCGLIGEELQVVSLPDGSYHVQLIVEDSSGACEDVCDMVGHFGAVVAVPNDQSASVCVGRRDSCG